MTTMATTPDTTAVTASPLRVGWIGGSEVVLRDVSLPAIANSLGLADDGRPIVFEAYTKDAPTPADTASAVANAASSGVSALIVTINPQWLYGRLCEGVEPAHVRYACLLEPGDATGSASITSLAGDIVATDLPTLMVLMPTSVDALDDPILTEPIAVANATLRQLLATSAQVVVIGEELTTGRPEFAEGVGFYDMVHPTPSGAQQLAGLLTGELLALLQT